MVFNQKTWKIGFSWFFSGRNGETPYGFQWCETKKRPLSLQDFLLCKHRRSTIFFMVKRKSRSQGSYFLSMLNPLGRTVWIFGVKRTLFKHSSNLTDKTHVARASFKCLGPPNWEKGLLEL